MVNIIWYYYEKSKTSELKSFCWVVMLFQSFGQKLLFFCLFLQCRHTKGFFFSLGSLLLTVRKSPNVEKTNYFQYAASCRYVPLPTHCVDVEDEENKAHSGFKYKEI